MSDSRNREPIEDRGFAQIASEYQQAHIVKGRYGEALIVVPGFRLCSGWLTPTLDDKALEPANICTVLFIRPAGFPAARPDHFFTDIHLYLAPNRARPDWSNHHDEIHGFEWWKSIHWFSWHLQMWDPNRDGLYQFLKVIHMRLKPAR